MAVRIEESPGTDHGAPTEEDLDRAKKIVAGDVPLMPRGEDTGVVLPRGLLVGGTWRSSAVVRELTGDDEEYIARINATADQYGFFDVVLARGVESLAGNVFADLNMGERKVLLGQLLLAEREILFLNVARVTFGDQKSLNFTCSSCGAEVEFDLLISEDIKIKETEFSGDGQYEYHTNKGQVISYRLATGHDQEEVLGRKGLNVSEQNTIMLSRCVTKVDGAPVIDPLRFAKGLTMKDRAVLIDQMVTKQPSPDMLVKVPCSSCGVVSPLSVGWGDIFRP